MKYNMYFVNKFRNYRKKLFFAPTRHTAPYTPLYPSIYALARQERGPTKPNEAQLRPTKESDTKKCSTFAARKA